MSLARDPDVFERFEKVVVVHGVRRVNDLAYHDYISEELPHHEFLGDIVRDKLIYYPTVTREPWKYQGRVTDLFENGKLRSEEHTSELQSLMRTSYAVFCLKKKK